MGNALHAAINILLDVFFWQAHYLPSLAAQVSVLLSVFALLLIIAVPISAIAFNGDMIFGQGKINKKRPNRILRDRIQSDSNKRDIHCNLDATNMRPCFLLKNGSATTRTDAESRCKRRLDLANFATYLADHFNFIFIQWMILSDLPFCRMLIRTITRATCSIVIGRSFKFLSALWTSFYNPCSLAGWLKMLCSTFYRTVFACTICSAIFKLLATAFAYMNWVLFARLNPACCAGASMRTIFIRETSDNFKLLPTIDTSSYLASAAAYVSAWKRTVMAWLTIVSHKRFSACSTYTLFHGVILNGLTPLGWRRCCLGSTQLARRGHENKKPPDWAYAA